MDNSFWIMILQLAISLPFVLALIYLSLKVGGSKLNRLQQGKLIKIYERTNISKDNSLVIVRIGAKVYAAASTTGKIEIIRELEDNELQQITSQNENSIPQFKSLSDILEKLKNRRKG